MDNYLWLIIIGFYLGLFFLSWVIRAISAFGIRRAESKKYRRLLREAIPKVANVDLEAYQEYLPRLEHFFKTAHKDLNRIVFRNKEGNIINICDSCGGYMTIVRKGRSPFLGCSNYPKCQEKRKYSEIFTIRL